MSVLIKGMEMPKEGQVIVIDSTGQVWSNEWPTRGYTRIEKANAVFVPPHGRLIDADALKFLEWLNADVPDTNVGDTISRKAAIDAIKDLESSDDFGFNNGLICSMNRIAELPSAQRWIPVTERLPNSQEEVNVSVRDETGDTIWNYSSHGWLTTDKEYWIVDGEINDYVVAWMPLPEPFKRDLSKI